MTTWTERANITGTQYQIKPQYERAFAGFHPAYYADVSVLAQDGWEPPWYFMWAERPNTTATWTERTVVSATWTERT